MDIFDQAQAMDAEFRAMSIDAVKRRAAEQRLAASTGMTCHAPTECDWCGQAIPEARRLAVPGCDLCAGCQSQRERLPGGKA